MMKKHAVPKILGLIMTASSALTVSQTASAMVTSATSTGYGAAIDLELLGLNLKVDPLPIGASGSTPVVAPAAYNKDESFLNLIKTGKNGLIDISLPVLTGSAQSDVDGSAGDKITSAAGGVAGIGLSAIGLLGVPLLDLELGALNADATVKGDYGSLSAVGDSSMADLTLRLLGLDVVPHLDLDAAPNTRVDLLGLLGLVGIDLTLNEQLVDGDPNGVCLADSCSLEVNALRLSFDSFPLGLNVLDGDIVLGHAYAQMSALAVPVPATAWLFSSGVMALVGLGRRRKTQNIA